MNSINNILNYIKNKTDEEIKELKEKYLEEIKKISKNAENEIKKNKLEYEEKIENKKNELKRNFEIEKEQFKKNKFLNEKEKIIKKTINLAFKTFCKESPEEYLNFIKKLIEKNKPKENFKIIFGKEDHQKFKETYKNEKIEKTENFEHGFKFICENYELNFNMEEVFLENSLKLKTKIINALNLKGELTWKIIII